MDSADNAYVIGRTSSTDFPTTPGADPHSAALSDAFVAKINATGSALLYSTHLGGNNGVRSGHSIAVDIAGNAYVTGRDLRPTFPP